MGALQDWTSLEIAKLVASLATPIVVACLGFWISRKVRESDRRFNEARDERKEGREAEKRAIDDELYRRNALHIGLQVDCQFHGLRQGQYLTTFTVSAKNVGQVLHEFEQVTLRVRAIKDEPFTVFRRSNPRKQREDECARRVAFPHEVLKANLVPWNFVFIEPGVTQDLTLTTMIPADYSYLLAHVVFEYKEYWPHTAEAVFAVPAGLLRSNDAVAVRSGTIRDDADYCRRNG
ncbi:hypothetical protein A5776_05580 [Mycolicibacterium elephantis]|uniref:hypothetical protein n=1 Tax=Mycolicibacterium elephantis TaxID=81858 RepID=UPI0007EBFC93|nr:hypothetical protein [Mycolicibacterium elephantis]NLG55951.1 hypothetical protein [Rhodococcus sp. (in: high G+C Gram-positive bacteria)]OBE92979.1 hypothetical protein A5776_05580 [Mycolicibacterium elephantis]